VRESVCVCMRDSPARAREMRERVCEREKEGESERERDRGRKSVREREKDREGERECERRAGERKRTESSPQLRGTFRPLCDAGSQPASHSGLPRDFRCSSGPKNLALSGRTHLCPNAVACHRACGLSIPGWFKICDFRTNIPTGVPRSFEQATP